MGKGGGGGGGGGGGNRPYCNFCDKPGHWQNKCFKDPKSPEYRGNDKNSGQGNGNNGKRKPYCRFCDKDGHWSDLCYTDSCSPAYGQRNGNNGGGQNNDQQVIIANNEQGSDNQQGNDDTADLPQNSAHIQNMRQNYGTPVTMLYLALDNVASEVGSAETIRVLEMMLGSKVHYRDLEGDVVMDADLLYSVSPKSEASTMKKVRFEELPLLSFVSAATSRSGVLETGLIDQAIADVDVNNANALIKAIVDAKGGEKYIDLEDVVS